MSGDVSIEEFVARFGEAALQFSAATRLALCAQLRGEKRATEVATPKAGAAQPITSAQMLALFPDFHTWPARRRLQAANAETARRLVLARAPVPAVAAAAAAVEP